jgi:hypothetical protein
MLNIVCLREVRLTCALLCSLYASEEMLTCSTPITRESVASFVTPCIRHWKGECHVSEHTHF